MDPLSTPWSGEELRQHLKTPNNQLARLIASTSPRLRQEDLVAYWNKHGALPRHLWSLYPLAGRCREGWGVEG